MKASIDMRRDVVGSIAFSVVAMILAATAQQGPSRGPSTADERIRFVEITHRLEKSPLDSSLRVDREWALRWLIEVPDIHAEVCGSVLGGFLKEKKYPYSGEIIGQLTFSSVAFAIENPDKANDQLTQYVAGVEGALKAYNAILQLKPGARSKSLDEEIRNQSQGKLQEFVRDSAEKGCRK